MRRKPGGSTCKHAADELGGHQPHGLPAGGAIAAAVGVAEARRAAKEWRGECGETVLGEIRAPGGDAAGKLARCFAATNRAMMSWVDRAMAVRMLTYSGPLYQSWLARACCASAARCRRSCRW